MVNGRIVWEVDGRDRGWFRRLLEGNAGDFEWREKFRVSKETFMYIADKIKSHPALRKVSRRRHQTVEEQLATCLYFLASGAHYSRVGDACGWSVSTVSRCVESVSIAIRECLGPIHFKMPQTEAEVKSNFFGFMSLAHDKWGAGTAGIIQIVGAADGTHIPIVKPPGSGDNFINRKGFFSYNVHAVWEIPICTSN